jgi:COP9 signalosome complex subunit 1
VQRKVDSVLPYINRIEQIPDIQSETRMLIDFATAMASLETRDFASAALKFTQLPFLPSCTDMVSQSDIAMYGALTAMASMERTQVKSILEHVEFRQYLELDPVVRELLTTYCSAKSIQCLDMLQRMETTLQIDPFLRPHLSSLAAAIRQKLIILYCRPYAVLDLNKMAQAFRCEPYQVLETELLQLILDDKLEASLDCVARVLRSRKKDARVELYHQVSRCGEDVNTLHQIALMRVNALKQQIAITNETK